jgi:hypothetical protein
MRRKTPRGLKLLRSLSSRRCCRGSTVAEIQFYIGGQLIEFRVHADCKRDSILRFLAKANLMNVTTAVGPDNGIRLGIESGYIEGLNIYTRRER